MRHPLEAKVKRLIEDFMSDVIDMGALMASSPEIHRRFRDRVLDAGNDAIRDLNAALTEAQVIYKTRLQDLKDAQDA